MKRIAGRDENGVYRVDTADKVSEMISQFLLENDFEGYVKNIEHYWDYSLAIFYLWPDILHIWCVMEYKGTFIYYAIITLKDNWQIWIGES